MTRKPLGRGLSALLSPPPSPTPTNEEIQEVDIGLVTPSTAQPRTRFEESALRELAQSIQSNGVIQPLLVRRRANFFELVAGERRWRAAQLAGLKAVPVIVREIPDDKLLELALIENIQRQELNPIEEANAYRKLIDSLKLTQEEVAERVGRDRTYITNYLRVLRLPGEILLLVEDDKLSMGHARALLGLADITVQTELAKTIVQKQWSVRETEQRVRALTSGTPKPTPKPAAPPDPNVRAAEAKLRRHLGTQVRILPATSKPGGRIEIEYYSLSDLDRLYNLLSPPVAQSVT